MKGIAGIIGNESLRDKNVVAVADMDDTPGLVSLIRRVVRQEVQRLVKLYHDFSILILSLLKK